MDDSDSFTNISYLCKIAYFRFSQDYITLIKLLTCLQKTSFRSNKAPLSLANNLRHKCRLKIFVASVIVESPLMQNVDD